MTIRPYAQTRSNHKEERYDQMTLITDIARKLTLPTQHVQAVLDLLDEGATVPFMARYRKERTGGMDEEQLRSVKRLREELEKLQSRRESIISSLRGLGLFQGDLRQAIESAERLTILEDLYRPYRPKRQTRASKARDLGLEPLAHYILGQARSPEPTVEAKKYLKNTIDSVDAALSGARDIVAEWIADNPELRQSLRSRARKFASLTVSLKLGAEDPRQVYRDYYEFHQPLNRLVSHQVLAIDRGEREKILTVSVELPERDWRDAFRREYPTKTHSPWREELLLAIEDAAKRLLLPSIERETRNSLTEEAQRHAIKVFGQNLGSLLTVPPLGEHTILAIDPGFRTGCKIAIVDPTGRLLATATIYPHPPQKEIRQSLSTLQALITQHQVTVIAIGNGTASRETEQLVSELKTPYLIVSEAGASVYSASPLARTEFPDLDVSLRGAVSIARRVLDPLAELIKIDPKSVGVGMYQHDLDENKLDKELADIVESVVHKVGVELNTASAQLLSHLGGIGPKTAQNVVEYREKHGAFPDRQSLLKVKGLGPKAFELAAGFIRIRNGKNPLDATAIHPESYPIARQVLALVGPDRSKLDLKLLEDKIDCELPTLSDIIDQLKKPSRDPREELPKPILRSEVKTMAHLYPGLELSGTVRNVVDFGAFIDIGVKQDGLIHRSKLQGRHLAVGQIIEVEILEIDEQRGRISLALL